MKFFIDMSTRAKLMLCVGTLWLITTIIIIIAITSLDSLSETEQQLNERHHRESLGMVQIRSNLNQARVAILEMMLNPSRDAMERLRGQGEARFATIDSILTDLQRGEDPGVIVKFEAMARELREYRQVRDRQVEILLTGRVDEARALGLGEQEKRYSAIRDIALYLDGEAQRATRRQLAQDMENASDAKMWMLALGCFFLALGVGVIVVLNRTIAHPLTRVAQTAARIANRDDLDVSFTDHDRVDEVGVLVQGFRRMLDNLQNSTADISEARRLQEEMRAASTYARNLIEASLDPLVTINAGGKITDVNRTTMEATGSSREQLVGSDFADYFTDPEKARAGYRQVFANGFVRDHPLTLRHASGRTIDVLFNASVYRDEDGVVQGVFAAARDVTESKRMEKELQDYRDSLEDMVKARTADLANVLAEVKETVSVLSASTSEILASTTQIASGAAETATGISQTTTTVEEVRQAAQMSNQKASRVSESAQRVADASQLGLKAVDETTKGMQYIQTQMGSIAQTIVRLSEQSQLIGGIIASVGEIADQSNLLAVNAAIEAARAEEHGRGFTVVAQEIKTLAEQSKQATAKVRSILMDVQKATSTAVMVTEQGSKAVEAGSRQAQQAGDSIRILAESSSEAARAAAQIVASSQQQVTGMDQISLAMESINQAGAENASSMVQAERAARELYELGQKLKSLIEQYHA